MRHRAAALVSAVLTLATAVLAAPAPAQAAAPGVRVRMTRLPATFTAGSRPARITVVASTDTGPGCRRVRWSMLLRVRGLDLRDVRVTRLEDGPFPVRVQSDGDAARLTDVRFDPRSLCPGRTVTATYAVAFTRGEGDVSFRVEAFDGAARLLQSADGTSRVVDSGPPSPTPATAEPVPSPTGPGPAAVPPDDTGTGAPSALPPAGAGVTQNRVSAQAGTPSLLGPGLIVGGILVLLGVGLLLRLRIRARDARRARRLPPTSFYPVPQRTIKSLYR